MIGIGQPDWEEPVRDFLHDVLLTTNGTLKFQIGNRILELENFKYSAKVRSQAVDLLSPTYFALEGWQGDLLSELEVKILQRLQLVTASSALQSTELEHALKRLVLAPELRRLTNIDLGILKVLESF
jgi:hypothetical protein